MISWQASNQLVVMIAHKKRFQNKTPQVFTVKGNKYINLKE